jgi:hypothetical protein
MALGRRPAGSVGDIGTDGGLAEEVVRVLGLGRRLGSVGLLLIRRRAMGSGRLLRLLGSGKVARWVSRTSDVMNLGEGQSRMRTGSRRPQARHRGLSDSRCRGRLPVGGRSALTSTW